MNGSQDTADLSSTAGTCPSLLWLRTPKTALLPLAIPRVEFRRAECHMHAQAQRSSALGVFFSSLVKRDILSRRKQQERRERKGGSISYFSCQCDNIEERGYLFTYLFIWLCFLFLRYDLTMES